jgi:dephospho-CoA kinase
MTRSAAKKRIQSQLPNVTKSNRADFIINTDCSQDELEEAVDLIYCALTLW